MCTIAYESMPTDRPFKMGIFRRLLNVDVRVWFFMYTLFSTAYDITRLELVVRYGLQVDAILVPTYLLFDVFTIYAAIRNSEWALHLIQLYTTILLICSTILAVICPVWMVFEFDNGAPEQIRVILEHNEYHKMGVLQSLAYCVYAQCAVTAEVGVYLVQLWLVKEVMGKVREERREVIVEMERVN